MVGFYPQRLSARKSVLKTRLLFVLIAIAGVTVALLLRMPPVSDAAAIWWGFGIVAASLLLTATGFMGFLKLVGAY
jgi:hypothetical protein